MGTPEFAVPSLNILIKNDFNVIGVITATDKKSGRGRKINSSPIKKIALKYNQITKEPVIKKIERVSKPGLRRYSSSSELPRVLNGLGVNIVSTSKGLMTGKKAKRENLVGEIICNVY